MTTVDNMTARQVVLTALHAAGCKVIENAGGRIQAQCPVHDDRTPSMSVSRSTEHAGAVVIHCHAGCDTRDILDALGLSMADLFPPEDRQRDMPPRQRWDAYADAAARLDAPKEKTAKSARVMPENTRREKVAHYDYHAPDGTLIGRVVRFAIIDTDTGEIVGKTFVQQGYDGNGGWHQTLNGAMLPLFRAPEVAAAVAAGEPVMLCEGERDALTAAGLGVVGTTMAGGAGKWRDDYTDLLAGGVVVIVADNDPPGIAHATGVYHALLAAECRVKLVLPRAGKDLTDHCEAGYGLADLRPFEGETQQEQRRREAREKFPTIDWHELWQDDSEEEWIVEPLLPARRLVALYSAPKVGKSLLMLNLAAEIARGGNVLGVAVPRAMPVLYVDFENDPRADVRSRLQAMGFGPSDLADLHYLSFPSLAKLDSEKGAVELLAAVDAYGAQVVVIDTVSRAIGGDENENDTWLAFYRHTGVALKRAEVALIRLDHSGKDESKGQRGGSAKSGDVDAVWRLSAGSAENTFHLDCEASRLPIVEKSLVFQRVSDPWLRHQVDPYGRAGAFRRSIAELVEWLDAAKVANDATERECREAMKGAARRAENKVLREAMKIRKARDYDGS